MPLKNNICHDVHTYIHVGICIASRCDNEYFKISTNTLICIPIALQKINSTELRNCTRIEIINNITISVQIIEHDNNTMENKDYKNTLCKGLLLY